MKGETSLTKKLSPGRAGPILSVVAPRLCFCVYMYVCWLLPAGLLPLCNPGKHAQSDSDKHTKHPPITVLLACSLLNPVWLLGAGGWCIVVWPQPDKAAAPLLFYLSVITHLHASVYPCTHLTHRLPSTNTCSPPKQCLCLKTWVLAGLCLCPCPHRLPPHPEPPALASASRSLCVRVHVCLVCLVGLLKCFSKPHFFALFQTQLHSIVCFDTKIHINWYLFVWFYFFAAQIFFLTLALSSNWWRAKVCFFKSYISKPQKSSIFTICATKEKKKKNPLRDRNWALMSRRLFHLLHCPGYFTLPLTRMLCKKLSLKQVESGCHCRLLILVWMPWAGELCGQVFWPWT